MKNYYQTDLTKTKKELNIFHWISILSLILCIAIILAAMVQYQADKQKYTDLSNKYDDLYSEYEECACVMSEEEAIGDAIITPMELNIENLYTWCLLLGAKHPEVLVAQAQAESHIGKSNLGKNYNNIFGMKYSKNDILTIGKTDSGFAIYMNWQHSVIARIRWDNKYNNTDNFDVYLNTLSRVYATDTIYKQKLIQIIKKQNLNEI